MSSVNPNLKRKKYIKVYVDKNEYENVQVLRERLFIHSPTLSVQDLFRLMLKNVDVAMIEYLQLEQDDPIKIQLFNKALFKMQLDKE